MDEEEASRPAGGAAGDGDAHGTGAAPGTPDDAAVGLRAVPLGPVEAGACDDGPDAAPGPGAAPGAAGRPWWARRPLVVSTTTVAAIAALTLAAVVHSPSARAGADGTAAPGTAEASRPATTPAPTTTAQAVSPTTKAPSVKTAPSASSVKAAASAQDELRTVLKALPDSGSGHYSVAVTDLDGGAVATYDSGATTAYDTASIVKVDILASLLLQHQHAGTHLTAGERALATAMIEESDNDAALTLWHTIGSGPGLRAANATLGLDHTTPGSGELWGLTQTTAADQVTLLRAVYGAAADSPLSADSRDVVSGLMRAVDPDQRWGVSAADSDGAGYAIKNGWLPRSATGLWDINSVGEIRHDGHTLLIAVLSGGHLSEQAGISLVERVAAATAEAVA
ncbi:Beta-lactamase class A [Actinacidiphila alni]|uniref:Beta-lactamase class A n=1 Tax=Actinacidiphila alni TaxID=380248 RepID=A0A1I2F0H4_9ACTN|nr:serine hydrolase [Actinacidiphila alni]SFE98473.1 Beta-lactamase class A [Actinacidiphila alni]